MAGVSQQHDAEFLGRRQKGGWTAGGSRSGA